MQRAVITLLTMICFVFEITSIRNTSFALDGTSNAALMDTISCERKRLILSNRGDGGLSPIVFPKRKHFRISQFEIKNGLVEISLSKEALEQVAEKYRGRYLKQHKKNLKNFSLEYRKDGRFHGTIDFKLAYDPASSAVAYECDATIEQIEASILAFQAQKTASKSEPNNEGRIKALEAELAPLSSKPLQAKIEQTTDTNVYIMDAYSDGPLGNVFGRVTSGNVSKLLINDEPVKLDVDGAFTYEVYVPSGGIELHILTIQKNGVSKKTSLFLDRSEAVSANKLVYDNLNPLNRKVQQNNNAIALVIGVEDYEKIIAKASYAAADANVFSDYATLKLGIPANRVSSIKNQNADLVEIVLLVQDWLVRAISEGETDVYIFFAGHGLASDDGEDMYLLPYDGSPRLLDRTAILSNELFANIAAANPRSVTVFLDTCYSGTTRGPDMLIASRPIAIRAKEQAVPEGFTVMTAAAGDQTAKPLEEAKHGMFSYFLMKGMEGDADANQDNQITAGELHAYVQQNVIQQSSGSQTPELQGDADRVLVRFQ